MILKKWFTIVLTVLIALVLLGCSEILNDAITKESGRDQILGSWQVKDSIVQEKPMIIDEHNSSYSVNITGGVSSVSASLSNFLGKNITLSLLVEDSIITIEKQSFKKDNIWDQIIHGRGKVDEDSFTLYYSVSDSTFPNDSYEGTISASR